MREKVLKSVTFILILMIADLIVGTAIKKMYFTTSAKGIAKIRYTLDSISQSIIIYGSSRAVHHYIPDTISKYTGMSCYNSGVDGQGLAFSYIQITQMLKRHIPQVIILDISPNIILDTLSDEKLSILRPYIDRDTLIKNILINGSFYEKIKYFSSVYPYNGNILSLLVGLVYHNNDTLKGYVPIFGILDPKSINQDNVSDIKISKSQIYYLQQILKSCKTEKIKIFLVSSPIYRKNIYDNIVISEIKKIAEINYIGFLDYTSDSSFLNDRMLFKDNLHLNQNGAALFSKKIAKRLQSL
jgi:hypothetical protein